MRPLSKYAAKKASWKTAELSEKEENSLHNIEILDTYDTRLEKLFGVLTKVAHTSGGFIFKFRDSCSKLEPIADGYEAFRLFMTGNFDTVRIKVGDFGYTLPLKSSLLDPSGKLRNGSKKMGCPLANLVEKISTLDC